MFNPADRALPPSARRIRDRVILAALICTAGVVAATTFSLKQIEPAKFRRAAPPHPAELSESDVTISEIVAANAGGLRDEDGDSPGWIELHNASDRPVDLAGWTLTDDKGRWDKWVFPSTTIEPGAYRIVFASGKDRHEPDHSLHTNFRLDDAGEYLALHDSRARPRSLFMPRYPRSAPGVAFGRDMDGNLAYLAPPTPGASPAESSVYDGAVAPLRVSRSRGLHVDAFTLRIACPTPNAVIRYTLDGSSPESDAAQNYESGIPIKTTTVVRALATREGYVSSPEIAHTFVFPNRVAQQQGPRDYPEAWGEGLPADYGIDPEVDAARFAGSLSTLPTLSVAMDPDDLFDASRGIYMNTEEDGVAWERPCSIELFDPARDERFAVRAGIRVQGRSSRKPATSPKHSFRLLFKTDYGTGTLRHPVFGPDGPAAFETLVLRATSNYSWTFPLAEQRQRAQYVRDVWAKDTQRAMGHFAPHCRYVHLYLNGLYWGVYVISERPDAAFMESRTDVPAESFDVHKGGEVVDGTDRAWRRLFRIVERGVEGEGAWAELERFLDVNSFIDFMILNHYAGNENWDYGNWYAARNRTANTGFQFIVWDMESILGRVGENVVFTRNVDRPTELFHRLREEPRFRERFEARVRLHLMNGGALTRESASGRFAERAREIETAIYAESVRWGDYRLTAHRYRTGPYERYTPENHWKAEQNRLLEDYFPTRTDVLLRQYERAGLLR